MGVIEEELLAEEAQGHDSQLSLFKRVHVHSGNNVLLVDDNICNSIAVQFMFQRYDADADIATNGQEALQIIQKRLDEN